MKVLFTGVFLLMVQCTLFGQATVWLQEAEDARLEGTATLDSDCGNASGGEFVRLKGDSGNAVIFEDVDVPVDGTYQLNIHYFYSSDRILEVFVNDVSQGVHTLPAAHWCYQGSAEVYTMNIDLAGGVNKVKLQVANGKVGPFVDKVSVTDQNHIYLSISSEKSRLVQGDSTLLTVKSSSVVSQEVSVDLSVNGLETSQYQLKDKVMTIPVGADQASTQFAVPENTLDAKKTALIRITNPGGDARIGYPDSVTIAVFKGNNAYYVSSSGGDDGADGKSPSAAWKSLAKVSNVQFLPGDSILFKKGDEFTGQLSIPSSGQKGAPIVVSSYGEGELPVLKGAGTEGGDHLAALLINNQDYIHVENLELTNDRQVSRSGVNDNDAYGLYVLNNGNEVMEHIVIRNLTIKDVFSIATQEEFNKIHVSGIGIHTAKNTEQGFAKHIRDVLVDSCYIAHTTRFGIRASHAGGNAGVGNDSLNQNMNLVFRNNHTFELGGSGVQIGRGYNCLIEGNTFEYSGSDVDPRMAARGSGAWYWNCKNVIAQYNKCHHARGYADSYGMHIDFGNENVIFQYNYSEDSEGGFVEILGKNKNVGYRFNVSVNDGLRTNEDHPWVPGSSIWITRFAGKNNKIPSDSVFVYNNSIYVEGDLKPDIKIKAKNAFVYNNIFQTSGNAEIGETVEVSSYDNGQIKISNNLYYKEVNSDLYDQDAYPVIKPAQFTDPGVHSVEGYKLFEGSSAIKAGTTFREMRFPMAGKGIFKEIPQYPETDIYGNPVNIANEIPNIGAYNGAGEEDTLTSAGIMDVPEPVRVNVFPNPVRSDLRVGLEAKNAGKVRLIVTDLQGRKVQTQEQWIERGSNDFRVNLDPEISNGIYILNLRGSKYSISKRFVLYRE